MRTDDDETTLRPFKRTRQQQATSSPKRQARKHKVYYDSDLFEEEQWQGYQQDEQNFYSDDSLHASDVRRSRRQITQPQRYTQEQEPIRKSTRRQKDADFSGSLVSERELRSTRQTRRWSVSGSQEPQQDAWKQEQEPLQVPQDREDPEITEASQEPDDPVDDEYDGGQAALEDDDDDDEDLDDGLDDMDDEHDYYVAGRSLRSRKSSRYRSLGYSANLGRRNNRALRKKEPVNYANQMYPQAFKDIDTLEELDRTNRLPPPRSAQLPSQRSFGRAWGPQYPPNHKLFRLNEVRLFLAI